MSNQEGQEAEEFESLPDEHAEVEALRQFAGGSVRVALGYIASKLVSDEPALVDAMLVGGGIEVVMGAMSRSANDRKLEIFRKVIESMRGDERHVKRLVQSLDDERVSAAIRRMVVHALTVTREEKLELLANAAVNAGLGKGGGREAYFLGLVEQFTVDHVLVLRFFRNDPPIGAKIQAGVQGQFRTSVVQLLKSHVPEFREELDEYLSNLVQEVLDKELTKFPRQQPTVRSHQEGLDLKLTGERLSPLGREFYEFISKPKLDDGE